MSKDRVSVFYSRVSAGISRGMPGSPAAEARDALSEMAKELKASAEVVRKLRPYLYHLAEMRKLHDEWCSADGTLPPEVRETLPEDFQFLICQFIESENLDEAVAAYDKTTGRA